MPAAVDKASVAWLAELIKFYFRQIDGRGRHCVVEACRRGQRDYFFAFPEDHAQRSIEWVDGEFNPRPHNPAFEIVFVYSQADGTLDLNFRGGRSAITALWGLFAQAILKLDELPPDPKDERVYDLAQVGKSVPLHLYNVTQVALAATVFVADSKPPKTVNIRITHPNSCSLQYDEIDLSLRQMLEASSRRRPRRWSVLVRAHRWQRRVDVTPLTAGEALAELLAGLGASPGRAVAFSANELQHWPGDAVAALKGHGAFRPGKPGDTAV